MNNDDKIKGFDNTANENSNDCDYSLNFILDLENGHSDKASNEVSTNRLDEGTGVLAVLMIAVVVVWSQLGEG